MKTEALGRHAKLIRGITFKPTAKCDLRDEGAVACLRTKNVQETLDQSDLIAVPGSLVTTPEKLISPGDILVSSANSWNLVGKCCQVKSLEYPSTAGGFISILRSKNDALLDSTYLYRWFSSANVQRRVRSFGNQTTNISNLDHKRTLSLRIPLPPLAEQKRIAGILDAADALRAKRRESLDQLDILIQSTFLDMFGDPATNPMGWKKKTLSETGALIQIGPFGSQLHKEDYVHGGVPLINPKHLVEGDVVLGSDETVTEEKAAALYKYRLRIGDVIVGRRGEMGRCAVVSAIQNGMLCGTGSLFIRPNTNALTALYLSKVISSGSMKQEFERIAGGVTMANLNRSRVESVRIGLPPVSLQHRFATIAAAVERQKARCRAHLAELDTLFAALQARAFNGDL